MKHCIKKKLHSESGASFLLALVVFLVASMVAVTIVAASMTALKRVHSDREAEQKRLALTSAAQFVRDEMINTKCIKKTVVTDNGSEVSTDYSFSHNGSFGLEMENAVKHVDLSLDSYRRSDAFQLDVTGLNMPEVTATIYMEWEDTLRYDVTFTLEVEGSKETVYLKMDGSAEQTGFVQDTNNGVTTTEYTIVWKNPIISSLGGTDGT